MTRLALSALVFALAASPISANAAPISTNFNALTPGNMVTGEYSPMGATFSLVPSPTEPGSPLPPPVGPTLWSLGPVDQYGVNGNSIIVGPSTSGPFYDVQIDFDRPIDYFSIVALDAETLPLRVIAYSGGTQVPLTVRSTSLGTISALPYVSGPTYLLEIGEAGGAVTFDRIVFGGTEQFDNLTYSPVPEAGAAACLIGDKDGFGTGVPADAPFDPSTLPGYDGPGDADGTDKWFYNQQSFTLACTLPESPVVEATLEVFAGGVGTDPANVSVGKPASVFLNGTFIGYLTIGDISLGGPNNFARKDVIDVTPYLGQFTGSDTITFRPCTTGTAVGDGWVLDYTELTLKVSAVDALLEELAAAVVGVGPGKSLANKVAMAQTYYAVPDDQATCAVLHAFMNEVRAQRGKEISPDMADNLIADAQAIMTAIGCDY